MSQVPASWQAIYELVALIPRGRVTTYGLIAQYLKLPGGARSVGWALNHLNRTDHQLPAHRVVNRSGQLTGYRHFGSPDRMQSLLESEGIEVDRMQIVRFSELLWDPEAQLRNHRNHNLPLI